MRAIETILPAAGARRGGTAGGEDSGAAAGGCGRWDLMPQGP